MSRNTDQTYPLIQNIVAAQNCTKAAKNPSSCQYLRSVVNQIHSPFGNFPGLEPREPLELGEERFSTVDRVLSIPHPKFAASSRFHASHTPNRAPISKIVAPANAVQPPALVNSPNAGLANGRNTKKPFTTQTILPTVNSWVLDRQLSYLGRSERKTYDRYPPTYVPIFQPGHVPYPLPETSCVSRFI